MHIAMIGFHLTEMRKRLDKAAEIGRQAALVPYLWPSVLDITSTTSESEMLLHGLFDLTPAERISPPRLLQAKTFQAAAAI